MKNHRVYITASGVIVGNDLQTENRDGREMKRVKIQSAEYDDLLHQHQIRNVDRISQITLAAAELALRNRGLTIEKGSVNDFGILLGTQFSALESIHDFDMEALERGALGVNPGLFPNTVLNSPACQASIQLSFAGPVYTVCNGLTSGLDAVGIGYHFVKSGLCSMVLAGAVDEIADLQGLIQQNGQDLGEAGGFVVLEGNDTWPETRVRAEIVGYKSRIHNEINKPAFPDTVAGIIAETVIAGDSTPGKISYISLSSTLSPEDGGLLLSEICKVIKNTGYREYLKTNWMGASGIVQSARVLEDPGAKNADDAIQILVNIDSEKVAVVALKCF